MMQTAQHRIADYPLVVSPSATDAVFKWDWYMLVEPLMRSSMIEVSDILTNETIQMLVSPDQHMVQTFSPDAGADFGKDG
jgi:hypothetical protein